jgi:hypothetical protein
MFSTPFPYAGERAIQKKKARAPGGASALILRPAP